MNVDQTGAMGNMQQMQMRRMDGSGAGQGNGGAMKEVMQQLPESDRSAIREQMQSQSMTQRQDSVAQIAELDTSHMTVDEIVASIMDILDPQEKSETTSEESILDIYA